MERGIWFRSTTGRRGAGRIRYRGGGGGRVLDAHRLPLAGWPEGPLTLRVGMYHPETLERLPAYDGKGQRLAEDVVVFREVQPDGRCGRGE